ncbi:aldo/keto reductase [Pseudonocardia hydrocarbonoxydans]|uniref:Oxidoreductase n=1 Tax=Pseudonocardia hydrocarbonoxydans TaxID=76726 RepID=A0A4Y3WP14_9PSEU|nr:aldo/keto reductase [Pseudonocardia hydrocarbonoxydans]GEC20001.1 oxidoreductase [Pseudonocardia hydrocarbonoxydans]
MTTAGIPSITLNDGTSIPQFGLGVWRVPPEDTAAVVRTALEAGYRHVDTAQMYRNETGVGQGIRDAGVAREDVWVTTKLAGADHGYERARRALDASLRRLGTGYVDLYLIHWPGRDGDVDTWRAFESLRDDGRARSIGVSNFGEAQIDLLVDRTGTVPSVNQIELNPRIPQESLRAYHRRAGIATESWAPLAEGALLRDRTIGRIAQARGRTPAQVVLRWHLQHGFVVIPKSVNPTRVRENIDITDFELSADDMAAIDALGRNR